MNQFFGPRPILQPKGVSSRSVFLGASITLLALLSGCGANGATELEVVDSALVESEPSVSEESDGDVEDLESLGGVEVERGLFSVKVTLPAELSEGLTGQDIADTVDKEGFIDGERNPDGSVTYQMSKAIQDAYLEEMRVSIQESVDDMAAEDPELIRQISFNDTVTQFDVSVVRSEYEGQGALSGAGFLGWSLAFQASFYQLFAGVDESERNVEIRFIDDATDEVFDTQKFPEDFE